MHVSTVVCLHPDASGCECGCLCSLRAVGRQRSQGEFAMAYYETQQQNPLHNSQFNPQQWGLFNPSLMQGAGYGLGQAAYGQQYGQYGAQQPPIGAFGWGAQPQGLGQQQPQWWGQQQRQLSQQDVSEVVRQLLPVLPQILAQTQQPHAALGYAAYGQAPRLLSQQDVNEVVKQILPIVPQIVGMLQQGQPQLQYAAMQGGLGQGLGQFGQGNPLQNFGTQYGTPQFQAAFGTPGGWGQQQRQLSQQDVADITRQL